MMDQYLSLIQKGEEYRILINSSKELMERVQDLEKKDNHWEQRFQEKENQYEEELQRQDELSLQQRQIQDVQIQIPAIESARAANAICLEPACETTKRRDSGPETTFF
jgi:uncharacterized protein YeaO (DUF488 family)